MNAHEHYSLLLPTELLEKIIFHTWSSHLSTNDRMTFIISSLIVSRTWKAIVANILLCRPDVIIDIPSASYLEAFLRSLGSLLQSDTLCRITINPLYSGLRRPPYVPNLRTFRLKYKNLGFNEHWSRLINLPAQVIHLEISFDQKTGLASRHDRQKSLPEHILPEHEILSQSGRPNAIEKSPQNGLEPPATYTPINDLSAVDTAMQAMQLRSLLREYVVAFE
ncbi:hypothetical protein DXG03_009398 [Asterophora parasitica]|uniref:F-box domain-containing protein n=1 Tax=Asterophora parasitica TaxID=117018 RepID=A0A9P7GI16_9AGAR|nr:hypothetical protein DXG03_009398 [Asterophora parasitica]